MTPHTSPSWASFGVSVVRVLEKIDHAMKIIPLQSSKVQDDLNLCVVKDPFGWINFIIIISYCILHGFKYIMKALCIVEAQLLAYS